MWRQQNPDSRVEAFEQILLVIGKNYPAEAYKLVDFKTVVEDEFIIEDDFNFNQKDGTCTEEANDEEASGEEANHGSMESRISDLTLIQC